MYYVTDSKSLSLLDGISPSGGYEFNDTELSQAQTKALSMAEIYPNTEWYVHHLVVKVSTVFRVIGRVNLESETIDPADPS